MIDLFLWFYLGMTIVGTLFTISKVGQARESTTGAVAAIVTVINVVFVFALSSKLVNG